jgi:parvulin-like peptidyl-prolyl isomerase
MVTVLQIGDQTITAGEIFSKLAGYQMLPQLCRELIIEKAITGVEITPEEKKQSIEKFYTKNQLTTPEAVDAVLKRHCMTTVQLEALATKELRIEKFKQATWGEKLELYFLNYKPQLDKVVYSLLRTQSMEVAQELFFRIQAGEKSFADCAREYSQGAEAQTGGLVGPVVISQPHPVISQKLATLQPGQLLPPMKLENWVVILRLEKLLPAQLDDAMRSTLLNHLFEQWLAEQLQQTSISLTTENKTILPTTNYYPTPFPLPR